MSSAERSGLEINTSARFFVRGLIKPGLKQCTTRVKPGCTKPGSFQLNFSSVYPHYTNQVYLNIRFTIVFAKKQHKLAHISYSLPTMLWPGCVYVFWFSRHVYFQTTWRQCIACVNLLINGLYTFSVDESPSITTTGGCNLNVCVIYCTEHIWKVANGVELLLHISYIVVDLGMETDRYLF